MFEHGFPKHWSTLKKFVWLIGSGVISGASAIWKTVTGALIHITDALASPVKELSVEIDSETGETGCNVWCTGNNIMNAVSDMLVPSSGSGVSISDGVLTALTNNTVECGIVFPVKPGTKYTAGFTKLTGGNIYVRCAEYSDKPTSYASASRLRTIIEDGSSSSGNIIRTFTTGAGAKYVFFGFRRTYAAATVTADKWFACLYGSGTTYTQYQGTTHPISWETEAGSITSGTLTVAEDGGVTLTSGGNTYQLASITPISTIAGENNIWADVNGEITLIYKAQSE